MSILLRRSQTLGVSYLVCVTRGIIDEGETWDPCHYHCYY